MGCRRNDEGGVVIHRSKKLRDSAKHAPWCFSCGRGNAGGNLVLAHSNALRDGRGASFRSHDVLGAIVCNDPGGCHDLIDGRAGKLTKEEKHLMQMLANRKTVLWWIETGLLVVK